VKLGLLTAAFPQRTLEEVASWSGGAGFEALEVAAGPGAHLDVESIDPDAVLGVLAGRGIGISALAYYPNNLDPDDAARESAHAHLRRVVDAAARLGVGIVCTFAGADPRLPLAENLDRFRRIWPPLVGHAEERGVRIAIENCPMVFSSEQWPGGTNLAYCPAAWDAMFEAIPSSALGLNLDPSHLAWLQVDYVRAVRDYAERILHVHAKDTEVRRDDLHRHSILSLGVGWQTARMPGRGEIDWGRFVGALRETGYGGAISVEHEDEEFEGSEQLVERGFEVARDTLRPLLA
jgi:sugar phosphate isomerase/epimerase